MFGGSGRFPCRDVDGWRQPNEDQSTQENRLFRKRWGGDNSSGRLVTSKGIDQISKYIKGNGSQVSLRKGVRNIKEKASCNPVTLKGNEKYHHELTVFNT